jgi:hypothetical protein
MGIFISIVAWEGDLWRSSICLMAWLCMGLLTPTVQLPEF